MGALIITETPFAPPPGQRIWRYLSLEKFVHLLATESLFFCRIDELGDPFEGSITQKDADFREFAWRHFEQMRDSGELLGECETRAQFDERIRDTGTVFRRSTFVSCWHASDYESAAMWSLYADKGRGIAISSTCTKLAECLPESMHVGQVRYIDRKNDWTPQNIWFPHALQKLRAYEHEHEVRAIHFTPSMFSAPEIGKLVAVSLNELIIDVYVAPRSSALFREVVQQCMDKFGLHRSLRPSDLDESPVF